MSTRITETMRKIAPPQFRRTAAAEEAVTQLADRLTQLVDSEFTPSSQQFSAAYGEVLNCYDRWQQLMVGASDYTIGCSNGCAACCSHWVEDVGSFEVISIIGWLRTHHPDEIPRIIQQCSDDCDELLRLEQLMGEKLAQYRKDGTFQDSTDTVDLLLSVFYQMDRPCPLLDSQGACMVYPMRPFTCRMYVSVSDPVRCDPEYINDEVVPTCLVSPGDRIDRLLGKLHERFSPESGDTGLRSQLYHFLTADC